MQKFIKEFEIRWNDLDANRHVANSAFAVFMVEARMGFLGKNNITQADFDKLKIGPVIFNESFHYIREVKTDQKIYVDVELIGNSEDFKFWKLSHSLFLASGELAVYSEVLFGWLNLIERKLVIPPESIHQVFSSLPKSPNYKTILSEETRNKNIPYDKTFKVDLVL
jgi:acyl-CoA thioester hydrolase